MNTEMITGYANAPAALQVQKDLLAAPMSDYTILPNSVSSQREAVTAESIVRANHCSPKSACQVNNGPSIRSTEEVEHLATASSFELSEDDLANVFTMLTDDGDAN